MQLGVQRTCDEAEIDILDRPNGKPIEVACPQEFAPSPNSTGLGVGLR
jgi:hypothetical protein